MKNVSSRDKAVGLPNNNLSTGDTINLKSRDHRIFRSMTPSALAIVQRLKLLGDSQILKEAS